MEEEEAASWKDIPSSRPKEGGAIFAVLAAGPHHPARFHAVAAFGSCVFTHQTELSLTV
jgi:hypothetical protein